MSTSLLNKEGAWSKSDIVKLSRFILALKFCGEVPSLRANSETLIFERTHTTFICSLILIWVPHININLKVEGIKLLFYTFKLVPMLLL